MGDRLWADIPPRYVRNRTQPCIPAGSLHRVLAFIGWGKGGNVTSAGWQVTLFDPIMQVPVAVRLVANYHTSGYFNYLLTCSSDAIRLDEIR